MPRTSSWCTVLLAVALVSGARSEDPKKDTPAKPPTFKAPKGWNAVEGPKSDIVQVTARFKSGEGEKAVEVIVISGRGGLVNNVNRWRGQLRLESLDEKGVLKSLEEIKVDGLTAHRLDITGTGIVADKPEQRIVAIMVDHGDVTWFIKMSGSATAVGDQKAALDEFVKSIRFAK